ncbi:hypothetical protein CJ255_11895 [Candidatus Viridilinea mediisalina]|uniref:Uncharacterized protein n=1 Tax=Candidatus Viridilinea mediisalina TaxID=2024553 RepID=A0A2A6RJ26_9CHLR|nr:hypothetical protein CJ255_11895 [Candidatus Viridilinea mediisalina]
MLIGGMLFMLRRLVLPTSFELAGVPFTIAINSALNLCYTRPGLITCSDAIIVVLTSLAVAIGAGWRSWGRMFFALIFVVTPIGLYILSGPIWLWLPTLALLPVVIEGGSRLLAPYLIDE